MINTGGFGVNVMPQLQPVDPALYASNPTNITQGVLQSLQVADTLAKIQAFKRQEAEAQALAPYRLAGEQAGYQTQVQNYGNLAATSPSGNKAIVAKNEATAKTAPVEANVTVAQGKGALKDLAAKEKNRAVAEDINTRKLGLEQKQVGADEQMFQQKLDLAKSQLEVANKEAQYARDNFAQNKIDERALKLAETKLKNAEADNQAAQADYNEFIRGQETPYKQNERLSGELFKTNTAISQLLRTPVPDPTGKLRSPYTLSDYLSETKEGGKTKVSKGFLGLGGGRPAPESPEAEALAVQLQGLIAQHKNLAANLANIDYTAAPQVKAPAKDRSPSAQGQKVPQATNQTAPGGTMQPDDVQGEDINARLTSPSQAAQALAPKKVTSKQEYDKLEPGTKFVGQDGHEYVKPYPMERNKTELDKFMEPGKKKKETDIPDGRIQELNNFLRQNGYEIMPTTKLPSLPRTF